MKKTIFDLNAKEEFNLMKELIKTCYGRQYFKMALFSMIIEIVTVIIMIVLLILQMSVKKEINYVLLLGQFLIVFTILIFSLLSRIKWMDLVKKYYDEKKK